MSGESSRRGGKQGADRGRALEDALDQVHALLRPRGIYVARTCPPSRVVRMGGRLSVVYENGGLPDYHAYGPFGFVAFEAKQTSSTLWSLSQVTADEVRANGSVVEGQASHLDRAARTIGPDGRLGIAGVVLRFHVGLATLDYWLPWGRRGDGLLGDRWREASGGSARGRNSLDYAACEVLGRRITGLDWTAAVSPISWRRDDTAAVTLPSPHPPVPRRTPR